jgi:hypothetical protein
MDKVKSISEKGIYFNLEIKSLLSSESLYIYFDIILVFNFRVPL